jgi:exo-beta-1,3-glucanase (GH17 family)
VIGADDLRAIMKEPLTAARDAASVADAAFTALRVTVPTELGTFMDAVSSFEEVLNTAEVTTLQLTSSVNRIRSVLQRTLIIPELEDARNYEAYAAIRQMSANLARAAEYAITRAITIHELEPLTEELTAMDLALQIYGDVDKADQIVRYNPSQYFFYPRGEIIRFSA